MRARNAPKGSVIATAEFAGVMTAKRTADLIPLCHPLPISLSDVAKAIDNDPPGFVVAPSVRT